MTENIAPATKLFTELPFAFGPKSANFLICVGCCSPIESNNVCSRCGWPVCGTVCENLPVHRDNECKFIVNDVKCILPLRVLLTKNREPDKWGNLEKCVPSIVSKSSQCLEKIGFSRQEVEKVCGLLEGYAIDFKTSRGCVISCLYAKVANMQHNCLANVRCIVDGDDFEVALYTTVEVPKHGGLFINRAFVLWPTLVRLYFLKRHQNLDCVCQRCGDKTELGTNCNTLRCTQCPDGFMLPEIPLDKNSDWFCNLCPNKVAGDFVWDLYSVIQREIGDLDYHPAEGNLEFFEDLFEKYHKILHPTNGFMNILRYRLIQLYGYNEGYTLDDITEKELLRKKDLVDVLLQILDIISPGASTIRGLTLYELHSTSMSLARLQCRNGTINKEALTIKLRESLNNLDEASEILKKESKSTTEGFAGVVAPIALKKLKENFDFIIENP